MPDVSDMQLVRDYDRHGSEAAFAGLVRRHMNLVYSTAFRHVGMAAQAEEITQAVFVILARKAARLRPDTVLEAWLYETTRLTALRFLRGERRRQYREQEAHMQSTQPESDEAAAWQQLAPLLDEAMARLGKKDREAVLLRFFKEKNLREVAAAMQTTEAAAQSRVHRAVEKLRRFFTQRGVVLPAAVLLAAISTHSVQAAPAGLAPTLSAFALTKGAAAGGSTLTLVKGALKIMAWTKAKTAVIAGAVLILAAGTTTMLVNHSGHPRPAKPPMTPATEEAFRQESMEHMNQAKQWALCCIMFAGDHNNELPGNFAQMKAYAGTLSSAGWELVSGGNVNRFNNSRQVSQIILLREKTPRQSPDGSFIETYAFADGHCEVVNSPNDDLTSLEKKRGFLARPAGK